MDMLPLLSIFAVTVFKARVRATAYGPCGPLA